MVTSLTSHLRYAVIAFLFWIAVTAYPFQVALAGQSCAHAKQLFRVILENHFSFLSTAISSRGMALAFFVRRGGEFIIVGIDEQEQACIVAFGDSWLFAMERAL